jgi:hypothetical protein
VPSFDIVSCAGPASSILFTDDFALVDLNLGYDFGTVDLTSITSYRSRDVLVVRDATALTASITGGSIGLPEQRIVSIRSRCLAEARCR